MKISALIAAYNSAATIAATLDSVLCQTVPPDEILVMNDGSTDETLDILRSYEPHIKVFSQSNIGLGATRNVLISKTRCEMIAFLDADDLWHPRYLETQRKLFDLHPEASAYFIGHTSFTGLGEYQWQEKYVEQELRTELFEAVPFLKRFRTAPGHFVLSFSCIPKWLFERLGPAPFKVRTIEDVYLCWQLPFYGPVVLATVPLLGGYRGTPGSLSSNRLKAAELEVKALDLLEDLFATADTGMANEFEAAFHSKLRTHAKILMGAGQVEEAHVQLRRSLRRSVNTVSLVKSFALLSLSYFPKSLQPKWPSVERV